MRQPGLLRPLKAAELSDGTLRYLLLIAALLSPRPPSLMMLNEPESSLHPDLFRRWRGCREASARSQVVVVTHARALVAALAHESDCHSIVLAKELGETTAEGDAGLRWAWPTR